MSIDSYIDNRRIQFIYRIINEPIESWNAIGKYWWFPPFEHIVKNLSMLGLIFDKTMDIIYLFKFKDEIFEHLQTKKVSLNFKSSLLNQ
jgi:hypothetical protein